MHFVVQPFSKSIKTLVVGNENIFQTLSKESISLQNLLKSVSHRLFETQNVFEKTPFFLLHFAILLRNDVLYRSSKLTCFPSPTMLHTLLAPESAASYFPFIFCNKSPLIIFLFNGRIQRSRCLRLPRVAQQWIFRLHDFLALLSRSAGHLQLPGSLRSIRPR